MTTVKDWYIVSIADGALEIGKILWGIVINDTTCRFNKDDFVCTSKIKNIDTKEKLVTTHSGSRYELVDSGQTVKVDFDEFELLRKGFSPNEIIEIRVSPQLKKH